MSRDRVAVLAGLAAPLVMAVILVPFRSGLPNTDAALALILVVVAVAASGHRLAGVLAAVSAAAWFDFFLTVPYERFTITRRADIETTVLLAIGAAGRGFESCRAHKLVYHALKLRSLAWEPRKEPKERAWTLNCD